MKFDRTLVLIAQAHALTDHVELRGEYDPIYVPLVRVRRLIQKLEQS